MSGINRAIEILGTPTIGRACGVSAEAVRKWGLKGRMPRTEYTGETAYAPIISDLTDGRVPVTELVPSPFKDSAA